MNRVLALVFCTLLWFTIVGFISYSIYDIWDNDRDWVIADVEMQRVAIYIGNNNGAEAGAVKWDKVLHVEFTHEGKHKVADVENVPDWILSQITPDGKLVVYYDTEADKVYMTQSNPFVAIAPVVYIGTFGYVIGLLGMSLVNKNKKLKSSENNTEIDI